MTVISGAVLCIIGSIAFGFELPKFRGEARQLVLAQQEVGGDPPQEMTPQGVSFTGDKEE